MMVVGNHALETKDRARLDSSTKHSGGWLEERDNGIEKPWQSLGSGQDQMADGGSLFESMQTLTLVSMGGFVTPFET